MVQKAGVLHILTYKCAWRHSGVPFLDIGPSKSGPNPSVFYDFDLKMCFAPQRRAIFPDRDLQNGSGAEVFCTFWRTNVLRATAACHFFSKMHFDLQMCFAPQRRAIFQHLNFKKCSDQCGVLYIFTCKCASRHSGVPFFIALRNSYLRTRRFSEPTFRTSGTTNHWKNTAIRDVTNIFRALNFFLVTLHACWSSC